MKPRHVYANAHELAMESARKRVAERIRHARAGNAPEGAHVVGVDV